MSQSHHTPKSDLKKLLSLLDKADLFRDPQGRVYGTFRDSGQSKTLQFDGVAFRSFLKAAFYQRHKHGIRASELDEAINLITAKAQTAPVKEVFCRVGHSEDTIVLDLARDDGLVVQVHPGRWEVSPDSPAKFRHPKGMLPLPIPVRGSDDLRSELSRAMRIGDPMNQILLTCFQIGALDPDIPLPVLEVIGPQGAAKSTSTKAMRCLIDPNVAPVRRIPSGERDLFITAHNTWLLALDNVSYLPTWFSDAACAIATGGGYATRKLYKDEDETLFHVRRPVIVNSIHEVIVRPDLRDRAITVSFPQIPSEQRITEKEYWRQFHEAHPRILAAALDCLAVALLLVDSVTVNSLPRMADWYLWVRAATEDPRMGVSAQEFERVYAANRETSRELSIDVSPIGRPLLRFMETSGPHWEGTSTELLDELTSDAGVHPSSRRDWPGSPEALRHALSRIEVDLRAAGLSISYTRSKSKGRDRIIVLEWKR